MLYKRGNITITDPDAPTQEYDTFLCAHCNKIITIQPSKSASVWSPPTEIAIIGATPSQQKSSKRQRGFCFRCMAPVCGEKGCARCIPFEAKLEAAERSKRLWKELVNG